MFQQIQDGLLLEELELLDPTPFGAARSGAPLPKSVAEFRARIPLSTYDDYAQVLDSGAGTLLPGYVFWVQTTHRGAAIKRVPFTQRAYDRVLNDVLSLFVIAAARGPGDIRLQQGDRILFNFPPRPYLSGYLARSFGVDLGFFKSVRGVDEIEDEEFLGKTERDFTAALSTGFDHLTGLASVLDRVAQRISNREGGSAASYLGRPRALTRLAWATLQARLNGRRNLLPRDLWHPKGIMTWGLDAPHYAKRIHEQWGTEPLQMYAATEAGILATQSWGKKGMTFLPHTAFLEFIPAAQWLRSRHDQGFMPTTRLYHELEVGERYEVVITSFYGMPFLRYRIGHLIRVTSNRDEASGSTLPQIVVEGRADDIVDVAGFTRLDGQTVGRALEALRIPVNGWVVTKEVVDGGETLHIMIEPKDEMQVDAALTNRMHETLKSLDPFYADVEGMLGLRPLRVSTLPRGTLRTHRSASGMAGQSGQVALINPPEEDLRRLRAEIGLSAQV